MKTRILAFSLLLATGVRAQSLGYSKLVVNGSASPEGRVDGVVNFDAPGRQVFLFGGDGTRTLNDLWSYSLQTGQWKKVEAEGAPSPRFGHTVVFDSRRRRLVVFGGQALGFFNDTWAYDIAANRWSQLDAGTGPSRRYSHSAIYDASRDRMVVSHGFTGSGRFDDTWSFDFATNRWTDLRTSNRPLRRCLHHAVYDAPNDQMLLYGGCASGTPVPNNCPLDDLWSLPLGGNAWREVSASPRPRGRQWYGTAFDARRNRMVLFGGIGGGELNDTWEFDPAARQWMQASPTGTVPSARSRHEGVYVEDLGGVVFFGGRVGIQGTNEMWLYGGAYTPPAAPAERLPMIREEGVVGLFSAKPLPLAPGKVVSLLGEFGIEAAVTTALDSAQRLPTTAGEAYATFNGVRAPLFRVQADRIDAQVPFETEGAAEVEVRVGVQGRLGSAHRTRLQATSPEISPRVLRADGSIVTADNPARAGEVVTLFATGHGVTIPAGVTGAAASEPLGVPAGEVRVRTGGREVEAVFVGLAPGTVGMLQVNARLPDDAAAGELALTLEVGGVVSPEVLLALI